MSRISTGVSDVAAALPGQADVSVVRSAWGITRLLYLDDRIELTRLAIRRGGYSSRHHHRSKTNAFLVVQGRLLVITYAGADQTRRILTPSDGIHMIPAGAEHRFVALEDATVAYELSYATPGSTIRRSDILRLDCNGVFDGDASAFPG